MIAPAQRPSACPARPALQLLKPAAAARYAAEVEFDPKQQAQLSLGTFCTITGVLVGSIPVAGRQPVHAARAAEALVAPRPAVAAAPLLMPRFSPLHAPAPPPPRAGAWTTHDASVLQLLEELHCWAPNFLEARLKWRAKQPITVLELRASRLAAPLLTPPREEFFGCFSWVQGLEGATGEQQQQQLTAAALVAAPGTPALDDAAWAQRQRLCRQQLGQLADLQELAF